MKRLLAAAIVAVGTLAGCGSEVSDLLGDTCTSGGAAKAEVSNTSCTLAPGNATIRVTLCASCLASSAGCTPEFLNDGSLELGPTFCQSTSSSQTCSTVGAGCNASVRQAVCNVTIPAGGPTTRPMTIIGADNQVIYGQLNISPTGNSICTL